jgi:hypothetical protein
MAYGETLVSEPKLDATSPIITRPFHYGTAIGDVRPATRFSDGARFGVWYGSEELLTTIYETAYYWQQRFNAIQGYETDLLTADRRVFTVHARGMLVDLLGKEKKYPQLVDKSDYSFTNALGSYLHGQGVNGLIFRSARHTEGINIGAFRPEILSDVRHSCYLRYVWRPGSDTIRVEKTSGRVFVRLPSFSERAERAKKKLRL